MEDQKSNPFNEEGEAFARPPPRSGAMRAALAALDEVDLGTLFVQRASVRHLVGPFRHVMRVALEEVSEAAGNAVQLERGWKLFMLFPRMLLHRPPRDGLISKSKLSERFDEFARREWMQLIRASIQCDEQAAVGRRRKGRPGNDLGGFIGRHPHDPPRRRREQGDPLMRFLFSLGQHSALEAVQEDLFDGEFFLAYLDDTYVATTPTELEMCTSQWMRICGFIPASASTAARCGMQLTTDQSSATRWMSLFAGQTPRPVCGAVQISPSTKRASKSWGHFWVILSLWRPTSTEKLRSTTFFWSACQRFPDLQSAWSLLLHCASARANYLLRVVAPAATRGFAQRHNEGLWKCLCETLHVEADQSTEVKLAASMLLNLGDVGVEGRRQSRCPSMLGELGRLHAHDFQQAPKRREFVCA